MGEAGEGVRGEEAGEAGRDAKRVGAVEEEEEEKGGGGGGKEVGGWYEAQVETVMSRMLLLEEEASFLRRQLQAYESRINELVKRHTREPKHLVFELGANDGSWVKNKNKK